MDGIPLPAQGHARPVPLPDPPDAPPHDHVGLMDQEETLRTFMSKLSSNPDGALRGADTWLDGVARASHRCTVAASEMVSSYVRSVSPTATDYDHPDAPVKPAIDRIDFRALLTAAQREAAHVGRHPAQVPAPSFEMWADAARARGLFGDEPHGSVEGMVSSANTAARDQLVANACNMYSANIRLYVRTLATASLVQAVVACLTTEPDVGGRRRRRPDASIWRPAMVGVDEVTRVAALNRTLKDVAAGLASTWLNATCVADCVIDAAGPDGQHGRKVWQVLRKSTLAQDWPAALEVAATIFWNVAGGHLIRLRAARAASLAFPNASPLREVADGTAEEAVAKWTRIVHEAERVAAAAELEAAAVEEAQPPPGILHNLDGNAVAHPDPAIAEGDDAAEAAAAALFGVGGGHLGLEMLGLLGDEAGPLVDLQAMLHDVPVHLHARNRAVDAGADVGAVRDLPPFTLDSNGRLTWTAKGSTRVAASFVGRHWFLFAELVVAVNAIAEPAGTKTYAVTPVRSRKKVAMLELSNNHLPRALMDVLVRNVDALQPVRLNGAEDELPRVRVVGGRLNRLPTVLEGIVPPDGRGSVGVGDISKVVKQARDNVSQCVRELKALEQERQPYARQAAARRRLNIARHRLDPLWSLLVGRAATRRGGGGAQAVSALRMIRTDGVSLASVFAKYVPKAVERPEVAQQPLDEALRALDLEAVDDPLPILENATVPRPNGNGRELVGPWSDDLLAALLTIAAGDDAKVPAVDIPPALRAAVERRDKVHIVVADPGQRDLYTAVEIPSELLRPDVNLGEALSRNDRRKTVAASAQEYHHYRGSNGRKQWAQGRLANAGILQWTANHPPAHESYGVVDDDRQDVVQIVGAARLARLLATTGPDGVEPNAIKYRTLTEARRYRNERFSGFRDKQRALAHVASKLVSGRESDPDVSWDESNTFVFLGDGGRVNNFGGFGAKATHRAPIISLRHTLRANRLATVVVIPEWFSSQVCSSLTCHSRDTPNSASGLHAVQKARTSPKDTTSERALSRKSAALSAWGTRAEAKRSQRAMSQGRPLPTRRRRRPLRRDQHRHTFSYQPGVEIDVMDGSDDEADADEGLDEAGAAVVRHLPVGADDVAEGGVAAGGVDLLAGDGVRDGGVAGAVAAEGVDGAAAAAAVVVPPPAERTFPCHALKSCSHCRRMWHRDINAARNLSHAVIQSFRHGVLPRWMLWHASCCIVSSRHKLSWRFFQP